MLRDCRNEIVKTSHHVLMQLFPIQHFFVIYLTWRDFALKWRFETQYGKTSFCHTIPEESQSAKSLKGSLEAASDQISHGDGSHGECQLQFILLHMRFMFIELHLLHNPGGISPRLEQNMRVSWTIQRSLRMSYHLQENGTRVRFPYLHWYPLIFFACLRNKPPIDCVWFRFQLLVLGMWVRWPICRPFFIPT